MNYTRIKALVLATALIIPVAQIHSKDFKEQEQVLNKAIKNNDLEQFKKIDKENYNDGDEIISYSLSMSGDEILAKVLQENATNILPYVVTKLLQNKPVKGEPAIAILHKLYKGFKTIYGNNTEQAKTRLIVALEKPENIAQLHFKTDNTQFVSLDTLNRNIIQALIEQEKEYKKFVLPMLNKQKTQDLNFSFK